MNRSGSRIFVAWHPADRVYAENLAMIRRAGDLTQVEVAERLGVGQAVVSRLERRSDMLLSTLADYLHATGAEHPRIVAVLNGMEVELDLDQFREPRSAKRDSCHARNPDLRV